MAILLPYAGGGGVRGQVPGHMLLLFAAASSLQLTLSESALIVVIAALVATFSPEEPLKVALRFLYSRLLAPISRGGAHVEVAALCAALALALRRPAPEQPAALTGVALAACCTLLRVQLRGALPSLLPPLQPHTFCGGGWGVRALARALASPPRPNHTHTNARSFTCALPRVLAAPTPLPPPPRGWPFYLASPCYALRCPSSSPRCWRRLRVFLAPPASCKRGC